MLQSLTVTELLGMEFRCLNSLSICCEPVPGPSPGETGVSAYGPPIVKQVSSTAPPMRLWGEEALGRPVRGCLEEGSWGSSPPFASTRAILYSSALHVYSHSLMKHLPLMTGFSGETHLRTLGLVRMPSIALPSGTSPACVLSFWHPFLPPMLSGQHQGDMVFPP